MSNATKSLGPTMAKRKIASDQKDETSFQPSIVAPKPKKLKEVHKKAAVGERQSQLLNTQDIAMATVDLEHYGTEVIAVDHQPTNNALHVEEEGQCATLTACGSKPDTPEATPAASSSNIASKTTKNVVNANNKTGKGRIEKNWEKIEFIIQTRDNIKVSSARNLFQSLLILLSARPLWYLLHHRWAASMGERRHGAV